MFWLLLLQILVAKNFTKIAQSGHTAADHHFVPLKKFLES